MLVPGRRHLQPATVLLVELELQLPGTGLATTKASQYPQGPLAQLLMQVVVG